MQCSHENVRKQIVWERCIDCGAARFSGIDSSREWSYCAPIDGDIDILDALEAWFATRPWEAAQMLYGVKKEHGF